MRVGLQTHTQNRRVGHPVTSLKADPSLKLGMTTVNDSKGNGAYFEGELDAGGIRGADAETAIERAPFLPTERTAKK
jgi:hypothetical protein